MKVTTYTAETILKQVKEAQAKADSLLEALNILEEHGGPNYRDSKAYQIVKESYEDADAELEKLLNTKYTVTGNSDIAYFTHTLNPSHMSMDKAKD